MDASQTVRKIISKNLRTSIDRVQSGSKLTEDLEFDEIDWLELVIGAEEALGIDIPDDDVIKWRTVQDVTDYVATRAKGKGGTTCPAT